MKPGRTAESNFQSSSVRGFAESCRTHRSVSLDTTEVQRAARDSWRLLADVEEAAQFPPVGLADDVRLWVGEMVT
jgi:hypothetical protein